MIWKRSGVPSAVCRRELYGNRDHPPTSDIHPCSLASAIVSVIMCKVA